MKAGWQVQPLQSFCNDFKQDIVDGPFGSELQRKDYIDEGIPVLKIQNVKPFAVELKKMDYVSSAKFQELRRHSYRTGDIVMTKLGAPLGASAIVREGSDGVIVADLVRIRAQRINTEYLCYHLNSPGTSAFINSMQKGTTRPRVTLSVVRELPIAAPSTAEQQRIVATLDAAFDGLAIAKANAEKNLQNARAIFESYLQSVFTDKAKEWPDLLLGDVFHIGSSKRIYETDWTSQGVPFFGGREIVKLAKYGSVQSAAFISEEKYQEFASKYEMPQAGDILMTARGTIGVGYVVKPGDKFYYKDGNVISLRAKNLSNPQFVLYAFRSNAILDQLAVLVGTTVSHLPIEKAKMLKICMPTVEIQNFIVKHLEMMEAHSKDLESIYKRKLVALDELKKSLLHQAFSGAL